MSWDKVWEEIYQKQSWGRYPHESFIRFVAWNFYKSPLRSQVKILELGCGPGAHIWYLAREGFDAYGIDGSPTAIEKAGQYLRSEGLKGTLKVGDIEHLPWPDETFDAIGDNVCLTHNSAMALRKILIESQRVLKPGGLVFSRTFTDDIYRGKTYQQMGDLEYKDASDGPFAGRGFFRLSNPESIRRQYGEIFKILSLDKNEYTLNNGAIKISEWVIVCQK